MKTNRLLQLATVAALLSPLVALAHPGHDEPHDFEWDFGHWVNHPLASALCLAALGAGIWAVWQLVRLRRSAVRPSRVDAKTRR